MRIVIQRVTSGRVEVEGKEVGTTGGPGLVCYVGINRDDTQDDLEHMFVLSFFLSLFSFEVFDVFLLC